MDCGQYNAPRDKVFKFLVPYRATNFSSSYAIISLSRRNIYLCTSKYISRVQHTLLYPWSYKVPPPPRRPGSSVGIATDYGLDEPGIESWWGRDFPPVQTGPGAHPASCTMGTGSFPGVKCGRSVLLTTHPLLAPRSWNSRAIPLPPLWVTTGPVTGLLLVQYYYQSMSAWQVKLHTAEIKLQTIGPWPLSYSRNVIILYF